MPSSSSATSIIVLKANDFSFSSFNSFSNWATFASSVSSLWLFSGARSTAFFISLNCFWDVFESPNLVIHLDKVQCPIPYFPWKVSIDSQHHCNVLFLVPFVLNSVYIVGPPLVNPGQDKSWYTMQAPPCHHGGVHAHINYSYPKALPHTSCQTIQRGQILATLRMLSGGRGK